MPTCPSTSSPPKVAFCIAGAARAFPSPLLVSAFVHQFIAGVQAHRDSRTFLLLKESDTRKVVGNGDHFSNTHHDFSESDLVALFNSSEAQESFQLGSVTVLRGDGSPPGACHDRQCLVDGDQAHWKSFKQNTTTCKSEHEENYEKRLLMSALNFRWCAEQIRSYEEQHGIEFHLVAYSRPDLWWRVGFGAWCTWNSTRTALVDGDIAWIAPRRYLPAFEQQAVVYRDCRGRRQDGPCSLRAKTHHLCDCCNGGEYLMGAALAKHAVPVRQVNLPNPLVRFVRGMCETVIGPHYPRLSLYYATHNGVSPATARAFRSHFGNGDSPSHRTSCMRALRVNATSEHRNPQVLHGNWDVAKLESSLRIAP